jgi:hypothetical protein
VPETKEEGKESESKNDDKVKCAYIYI